MASKAAQWTCQSASLWSALPSRSRPLKSFNFLLCADAARRATQSAAPLKASTSALSCFSPKGTLRKIQRAICDRDAAFNRSYAVEASSKFTRNKPHLNIGPSASLPVGAILSKLLQAPSGSKSPLFRPHDCLNAPRQRRPRQDDPDGSHHQGPGGRGRWQIHGLLPDRQGARRKGERHHDCDGPCRVRNKVGSFFDGRTMPDGLTRNRHYAHVDCPGVCSWYRLPLTN
jgi:hypothetical protein